MKTAEKEAARVKTAEAAEAAKLKSAVRVKEAARVREAARVKAAEKEAARVKASKDEAARAKAAEAARAKAAEAARAKAAEAARAKAAEAARAKAAEQGTNTRGQPLTVTPSPVHNPHWGKTVGQTPTDEYWGGAMVYCQSRRMNTPVCEVHGSRVQCIQGSWQSCPVFRDEYPVL